MNSSSDVKMSLKYFKIIFFLILYLHTCGCLWYWIVGEDESWQPIQNVFTGNNLYEDSVLSRYIQSIFYSTLLFTGNDIGGIQTLQFIFCIPIIVIGALANANIFGEVAVIVSSSNRK